jgi:hypothetical protein
LGPGYQESASEKKSRGPPALREERAAVTVMGFSVKVSICRAEHAVMLERCDVEVLREAAADDAGGESSAQKVATTHILILAPAGIADHQPRSYKDVAGGGGFRGLHALDEEIGRVFADRGTALIDCG